MQISTDDLKVGDICAIKEGEKVPADGILLEGHGLQTDETALTGKSDEMKKKTFDDVWPEYESIKNSEDERKISASPILLSGSFVTTGEGYFICIAVGKNSNSG